MMGSVTLALNGSWQRNQYVYFRILALRLHQVLLEVEPGYGIRPTPRKAG